MPSENAFDRVKSLLGKLDRSIDDARRKRLQPEEETRAVDVEDGPEFFQTESDRNGSEGTHEETASRPTSKYGRARPIRDLNGGSNGGAWKTA